MQKRVLIIDASNPSATKVECIGLNNQRSVITLDWREQTYPNDDLPRLEGDHHGELKLTPASLPQKGQYGELYIVHTASSLLPPGKFPSELPSAPKYTTLRFRPLSLKLRVLTDNNRPSQEIELLLEQNANLDGGIRLVDGYIEAMLVGSSIVEDDEPHGSPPKKIKGSS